MESVKTKRLFVDMDGTLTVYRRLASVEQLYEAGYFREMPPLGDGSVVQAIQTFRRRNPDTEVYILSSVLGDHPTAKAEKNAWLDKYLPEVDAEHRIYPRCGDDKAAYVPGGIQTTDSLLDDYNKNLEAWRQAGGHSVKMVNDINNRGLHGALWDGDQVRYDGDPEQIAEQLRLHRHPNKSAEKVEQTPTPTYTLYQLKDTPELRDVAFCNLADLKSRDLSPDPANYEAVYTAPWKGEMPEDLWYTFNNDHPSDYQGRSMSVGDVIVFTDASGNQTAQFVDSFGFAAFPDFARAKQEEQEKEMTPLHRAALSGNAETVRELLEQGMYVDTRDSLGYTPLRYAAQSGSKETEAVLLQYGADAKIAGLEEVQEKSEDIEQTRHTGQHR